MVDAYATIVALMFFIASVIYLYLDKINSTYHDYFSQEKMLEWKIQFAQSHCNEKERLENEYLKNRWKNEYKNLSIFLMVVYLIIVIILTILLIIFGSSLHDLALLSSTNETPSEICQNVTYVTNNYNDSYITEQIKVESENRVISIKELQYLMQVHHVNDAASLSYG